MPQRYPRRRGQDLRCTPVPAPPAYQSRAGAPTVRRPRVVPSRMSPLLPVSSTRTLSGVTVTVPGRAFLVEAEIATTASWRVVMAAHAADGELAGELILAVHMGLGARQLPQVVGQLRNATRSCR